MPPLDNLEKILNIQFKKKELLKEALTHRSYLNEYPSWPVPHNERLEYLGDAVLELAVTEFLFEQYPEFQEGRMTSLRAALVNRQMLSKIAQGLSLGKFIYLSKGEAKDTGKAREIILSNAMEALLGAVYLDQGYEVIKEFVRRVVLNHLEEVIAFGLERDPKSLLQEEAQEKIKITPTYRILEEQGPDHQKMFTVGVFFNDEMIETGTGSSKQEAEHDAARNALVALVHKEDWVH